MLKKTCLNIIFAVMLFINFSCTSVYGVDLVLNNTQGLNTIIDKSDFDELDFVPGELIVKLDSKVSFQEDENLSTGIPTIDTLNKQFGLTSVKEIFHKNIAIPVNNLYKFEFSKGTNILDAADQYNHNINVIYAEPNYLFQTCKAPNDPLFSNQWAFNQLNEYDIHGVEAWDLETGSSNVVVAIIDTGVDYNHKDIKNNIWHDQNGNPGYDFVDIDVDQYLEAGYQLYPDEDYVDPDGDPLDVCGHGTHCAGIVGAVGDNSIGVTGVCWHCKIMPVKAGFKIKSHSGLTGKFETDDIVNAIYYAADNGADIISISFGGYGEVESIFDACNYAHKKGVLLIAAAGNDNSESFHIPSSYNNVISVGATTEYDKKALFSNHGQYVDVAAPGVNILSLRAEDTDIYDDGGSHIVDKDYYIASGTSMSCPFVSGLAALILSKDLSLSNNQLKDILINSVDKIVPCADMGKGRINAYEALLRGPDSINVKILSPSHGVEVDSNIDINGKASGSPFQTYVVDCAKGICPFESSFTEIKSSSSPIQNGKLATFPASQLEDGLYTVRLKVVTNNGIYFDKIWIIVNNQDNEIMIDEGNTNGPWIGSEVSPYQYIQDGIDAAGEGDTVFVKSGCYKTDIIVDKSTSLKGQDKSSTIIKGQISIMDINGINVSGFTLTGENDIFSIDGIYLYNSNNNHIFDNIFMQYSNGWGLNIRKSSNNLIYDNTFKENSLGIIATSSTNNKIYQNNFLNNEYHVYDDGTNQWDDGEEGNYWDDYKEEYPNSKPNTDQKTWDTPYKISGAKNYDNYPWINPNGKNRMRSHQLLFFNRILNLFEKLISIFPIIFH